MSKEEMLMIVEKEIKQAKSFIMRNFWLKQKEAILLDPEFDRIWIKNK